MLIFDGINSESTVAETYLQNVSLILESRPIDFPDLRPPQKTLGANQL